MIDLVISNYFEIEANVLITPQIGDQSMIKIILKNEICIKNYKIQIKSFKNYSKSALNKLLNKINLTNLKTKTFENKSECLINELKKCIDDLIVYKDVKVRTNIQWFSEELK